jgi:hypothetical protein
MRLSLDRVHACGLDPAKRDVRFADNGREFELPRRRLLAANGSGEFRDLMLN